MQTNCVRVCVCHFLGMQHSVAAAGRPFGVGLNETFLSQYLKGLGYSTHAIGKVLQAFLVTLRMCSVHV